MGLKNTWFNRTFRGQRLAAEKAVETGQSDVRQSIADLPEYEIPEEIQQQLNLLTGAGEAVRETTALAGEATDIARARAGAAEAPGEALARRDIEQSTARTVQQIQETGGGGAGTLQAIASAGMAEQGAMGELARNRLGYRSQAEQDLMGALRSEASLTADTEARAAALEAQGLGTMAAQKQQKHEYDLSKVLTGIQFEADVIGGIRADEQARRNRNAMIAGSIISGVTGLAGAAMTGGASTAAV